MAHACNGLGSRVRSEPVKSEGAAKRPPPHVLVVAVGNSDDPRPARLRQDAKRGARRRLRRDREIALQPPPLVLFNTDSKRLGSNEQGGVVLQGKDLCGVAVVRKCTVMEEPSRSSASQIVLDKHDTGYAAV